MKPTRRQFLLGAGGVAAAAAGVVLTRTETLAAANSQCAQIHAQLAGTYRDLAKSIDFTANNLASAAMNVACPCCGEPLFKFIG